MQEPKKNEKKIGFQEEFKNSKGILDSLHILIKYFPGTKRDLRLLVLLAFDLLFLLLRNSYSWLFPNYFSYSVVVIDIFTCLFWGYDFYKRWKPHEDKAKLLQSDWYEIIGLLPFHIFRPLLLLRALKLWISFYKLGGSREVSRMITSEFTFRFRDVIVDTIADAVFIKSVERVNELSNQIDYKSIVKSIFEKHKEELKDSLEKALQSRDIIKALSSLPLMESLPARLSEDSIEIMGEMMDEEASLAFLKDFSYDINLK
ncbi:MAG: hypothetical protein KDK45_17475, partial [Leptospiraceae bacterium]|nr:hypothetical protein [Leptospiraceae bacterium]